MSLSINQKFGKAVSVDTANAGYTLSDLTVSGETVSGATIKTIMWSTNNVITIKRGANTYFNLYYSGVWDLAATGEAFGTDATANVMIEIPTTGTCVLELKKISNGPVTY